MAMMQCPECGREISDAAAACPHCGYPITRKVDETASAAPVSQAVRKTKLGEVEKHGGGGLIAMGVLILLCGIFSLVIFPPAALGAILVAIICIVLGHSAKVGYRKAKCPYCEKELEIRADVQTCRCRFCWKVSTVKDDFLVTIE